ncbi:MAG: hypothetical protein LBR42_04905, partial [Candidatus Methanoplasma sp.]|nr:hypothetical protein [Candidatus Methanoplasma sp.]
MNRTNKALMGTLLGIASVYAVLVFVYTLMNINGGTLTIAFDPFGLLEGSIIPDSVHDAYWGLIGFYTGFVEGSNADYLTMALFAAGFALVAAGCASKPTRNVKGSDDDPQEYLFTHRPKAFLRCLMVPWNSIAAAWGFKKVPVVLPIIFIPFMLPFALIMDIILAVLFAIAWLFMTV